MSKKFSEEEFQEFVVEQFGKLATDLSDVRGDVASIREDVTSIHGELGAVRRDVANVQTGLADVRLEMQTGFRELRTEIAEIKGILEPLAAAFDADAEKIVEHDRRIGRLEEHVRIPKHA